MAIHRGEIIAARDGLKVVDCAACGYAHLTEMPDGAALSEFYQSAFWQKEKAGALGRFEEQRDWWALTHDDWLAALEAHTAGRSLCDMGCGYGYFMRQALMRGWDVIGIEPSESAARYAAAQIVGAGGLVRRGAWNDDSVSGSFDALAALWLIEHLPDPLAFLRWSRGRLAPGGALLVVVPNEFSDLQMHAIAVTQKDYFVHHTHINYFTPATLGNLLGRAGFQVVEKLATFPMESFILAGFDYTTNDELGAAGHALVEKTDADKSRAERMAYYWRLGYAGGGRDLVWIAKVDEEKEPPC